MCPTIALCRDETKTIEATLKKSELMKMAGFARLSGKTPAVRRGERAGNKWQEMV